MTLLTVRSVAGPDAGWALHLADGRHGIGRAPTNTVCVADPAIEAHHALVEVAAGCARLLQIAGRHPITTTGPTDEPLLVPSDDPADAGWSTVAPGTTLRLGHTWLRLGDGHRATPSPQRIVHAPLDASAGELDRFERDLRRAVAAERAHRRRATTVIAIGQGRTTIAIDIRDRHGDPVYAGELAHDAQRLVDRHTCPIATVTMPVAAVLGDSCLAVVARDPAPVVEAIVEQLSPADRRRSRIVTLRPGAPVPAGCTSLLDVGDTWEATWQPDLVHRPDRIVRLHARGVAPRCQSVARPAGRSSLNR